MQFTKTLTVAAITVAAALAQSIPSSSYTLFDYPNAASTQAWGINSRRDIVGVYVDINKATHGFLLSAGRYSSIDYPGAAVTLVNGINARGEIVGEYGLTAAAPHRGFLLSDGRFTDVDYAGSTSSSAIGITPEGNILGSYTTSDNLNHGFFVTGSVITKVDYPDATQSVVGGVGPRGDIVGSDVLAGVSHGFLLDAGKFTTWDFPGATFTNALGRNGSGDIVGRYRDAAAVSHGYLLSAGKFTSFDCPGATFTGAAGITPDGDIVGRCTVSGVSHGFLLKQGQQPRYTVTDLRSFGGNSSIAYGVNNAGWVAGGANVAGQNQHAFVYRDGKMTDLGTLGGVNASANNVNGSGRVSVVSETAKVDPDNEDLCGYGTHHTCLAALWKDGKLTAFPTLGGNNSIDYFLNERGQVAGAAETATRDFLCTAPQRFRFLPVVFGPLSTQIKALPLPVGDTVGFALGMNDKGDAVGGTGTCDTTSVTAVGLLQSPHAVVWKNGVPIVLGDFGGKPSATTAAAINDRGEVIGSSSLPDGNPRSFLWTSENGLTDLGTLGDDAFNYATSINNSSQISGNSCDVAFNCRAYLWDRGVMTDLNEMIAKDSPLYLVFAGAINDVGEIAGQAVNKQTGELYAFVASPSTAPTSAPSALLMSTTFEKRKDVARPTWAPGRETVMRRLGKR